MAAVLVTAGGAVGALPAVSRVVLPDSAATVAGAITTDVATAVCSSVPAGRARCLAEVRTDSQAKQARPTILGAARPSSVGPQGGLGDNGAYSPSYLQSAYGVYGDAAPVGTTIGIVDAFDDPTAASDLANYRSDFGLSACGSGCFTKVDENGGTNYPASDNAWAFEISIDLDMASAMCPSCDILLVEAASDQLSDLGAAENTAANLGAAVISNSYGSAEYATETSDDASYFTHPGVVELAASGDSGYGVSFPAASPHVVAVGGTTLIQTSDTGVRAATESAWVHAGSGCSLYEPKPAWQTDTGCATRTVADLSADADPDTGVWVYDTTGQSGFLIAGGTSAAAPIVAGVYALAGKPPMGSQPAAYPYTGVSGITSRVINDIVGGSNGSCPSYYLCNASPGYDGPTGLGTPNGLAAFSPYALVSGGDPDGPDQFVTFDAQANTPGEQDTVTFSASSNTSPDCASIALDLLGGAFCAIAFPNDGSFTIVATFSNGSQTATAESLTETVQGAVPSPFDFAQDG